MNLDDVQKQKVAAWIAEGLTLSQIQRKLASDWAITMTYMEVRFLMDDLKLKPKDKQPPPAVVPSALQPVGPGTPPAANARSPGLTADASASLNKGPDGSARGVSVVVDQVARPGALVSGKVTFSDGNSADWHLDQMGRLGLVAAQQGYRPSPEDLQTFQTQLQSELQSLGF